LDNPLSGGWPRVPFHYEHVDDFHFRLLHSLSDCHSEEDYPPAAKLALFLHGRGKLPEQIDTLARSYLRDEQRDFDRMRRDGRDAFADRTMKDTWGYYAKTLLEGYDRLMDLEGIINGAERCKREPFDKRFGVSLEFLKDVKKIRKSDW
jgi:hypothetical protein